MNKKMMWSAGAALAMLGGGALLMRKPKKRKMRSALGKTLKAMGEVADSVSDTFGW